MITGLLSGLKIWHYVSYSISHRCGSDPVLLWLAAAALIGPLAWELPYAVGAAVKKKKKKKKTSGAIPPDSNPLFASH